MNLTIALAQMNIALGDRDANAATVAHLAARAELEQAELLVLPELWGSGYDLERAHELSDRLGDGLFESTAILAAQHHVAICGSLLEYSNKGMFNTATFYDQTAKRRGVYRKTHLIGLMNEDRYLAAGREADTFGTHWGTMAMAICYDLRFPELFRRYAVAGAKMLIIPAEWPTKRIEHWRVLLQARAIENQCFVIGCNRVGSDRDNDFGGHSMIVDPWGKIVAEADDQETMLVATIDLDEVERFRQALPALRDRRPEVYANRDLREFLAKHGKTLNES